MKKYDLDSFENGLKEKKDGWLVYYEDVEKLEKENIQLKKSKTQAIELLNNFCNFVELSPWNQDLIDKIIEILD